MPSTLNLAMELIVRPSITPEDAGCQDIMMSRLAALGFKIEKLRFKNVQNFWARRGDQEPVFAFAGHTDVVPPGMHWSSFPFQPEVREGMLYGRGAADMKGSLAAMITACDRFIAANPDHKGSIAFLITSDEEGPAINGTVKVVDHLERRGEKINWCLVGEPTGHHELGDVIKNGRRGSLNGKLIVQGVQGHIAYPELADNPIHRFGPALTALCNEIWDQGNEFFPPTSFQISNIKAGSGVTNVIPPDVEVLFNFRYSTAVTQQQLQERVEKILTAHGVKHHIEWTLSGEPFLTPKGDLVGAVTAAVRDVTGREAALSTSGGTSDGRFIAPTGAQVVELGPINATIHKVDECVSVADLDALSAVYERVLELLLKPI